MSIIQFKNYDELYEKYTAIITDKYYELIKNDTEHQLDFHLEKITNELIKKIALLKSTDTIPPEYIEYELKDADLRLNIIFPGKIKIIIPLKYAIAAVIGALIGTFILAPFMRLTGITEKELVLVSNIFGIFITTYLYGKFFNKIFKTVYKYPVKKEVATTVKTYLKLWLAMVTLIADKIILSEQKRKEDQNIIKKLPANLIDKIYKLYNARGEQIKIIAQEIIQQAKQLGFEGFDEFEKSQSDIYWTEKLRKKYDTFGLVNEGDKIHIEEIPNIINGKIIKKGLVRRI